MRSTRQRGTKVYWTSEGWHARNEMWAAYQELEYETCTYALPALDIRWGYEWQAIDSGQRIQEQVADLAAMCTGPNIPYFIPDFAVGFIHKLRRQPKYPSHAQYELARRLIAEINWRIR